MLVGGGRWGRVHASNLTKLLTPMDEVCWVTRFGEDRVRDELERFERADGPRFVVMAELHEALHRAPAAAIVVSAAPTHSAIAAACLAAGLDVFVEKPLAFTVVEAEALVELAKKNNRLLAVGHHLLSASYLSRFKEEIAARQISQLAIEWLDLDGEMRQNEAKRTDVTTPIVHDIYPHIWSIVRLLTDEMTVTPLRARLAAGGRLIFSARAGFCRVRARISRRAAKRVRKVSIAFADGGQAVVDFTIEPGRMTIDKQVGPELAWNGGDTPVLAEIRSFLEFSGGQEHNVDWPHNAANCVSAIAGAVALADLHSQCLAARIAAANLESNLLDGDTGDMVWNLAVNQLVLHRADVPIPRDLDRGRFLQDAFKVFRSNAALTSAADALADVLLGQGSAR